MSGVLAITAGLLISGGLLGNLGRAGAYRTPLGQALLSLLLIMYVASLILMRRKAHQADRPRILLGEHR